MQTAKRTESLRGMKPSNSLADGIGVFQCGAAPSGGILRPPVFRHSAGALLLILPLLMAAPAVATPLGPYGHWPARDYYGDLSRACYYYGRCSVDELDRLRNRMQRLDRVTPQAPSPPSSAPAVPRDVEPTPEAHIQPEYRDASRLREAYKAKAD